MMNAGNERIPAAAVTIAVLASLAPAWAAGARALAAEGNLLTRPGFEAAEAALRATWRPLEPGGYEVDRREKHTGNQSIKLAVTDKATAKGASSSARPRRTTRPSCT